MSEISTAVERRFSARALIVTVACLVMSIALVGVPSAAFGQEDGSSTNRDGSETQYASPSAEQRRLNDEAARAIGGGDYTKAVSFLEEALYIGKLNVTYLNLGRAYQHMGNCEKARQALEAVADAPAVKKPSPQFIESKAEQFLAELDANCQEEAPAPGPSSKQADAEQKPDPSDDPAKNVVQPPSGTDSEREESRRSTLGWTATIGGVALAGGAIGMHLWAESLRDEVREPREVAGDGSVVSPTQNEVYANQDAANTRDTIGLSMGIVGGAAVATGVYLLVTDEPDEQPSLTVGPQVDGRGIVVGGTF